MAVRIKHTGQMHGWKKCLLVDVHLVDSLLLISRKNLELDTRSILQEMYQKRLSLWIYVICFYFYVFFKFVFGCLQLNFKQPIGAPKNRFLDSSRHLTRQVLSSIYVLHLKFLYRYRKKNCRLFLEEFPFPHHHGVRYDSLTTFSLWAAPTFESPIFSKDFWPPHCWELATCRCSQVVFDGGDGSWLRPWKLNRDSWK